MRQTTIVSSAWALLIAGSMGASQALADPVPPPADAPGAKEEAAKIAKLPPVGPAHGVVIDHSGRAQKGKASFYSHHFTNRKMADGRRMNPNSNIAASKQLPLGSVAKVTNLENGKTATVNVEDRGPYVDGRVVDLAPKVAEDLDIKHKGTAPVVVKPITVPATDGNVKLGAGAAEASPGEVAQAVETTKGLIRTTAPTEVAGDK